MSAKSCTDKNNPFTGEGVKTDDRQFRVSSLARMTGGARQEYGVNLTTFVRAHGVYGINKTLRGTHELRDAALVDEHRHSDAKESEDTQGPWGETE